MMTSQDLLSFGKETAEAFVKSGQIWTAGVQAIAKDVAASAQAQMQANMATVTSLASVKTPKDLIDMQTSLARKSVETAIADTTRITDASARLATDTMAPLAAQMMRATQGFAAAA